MKLRNFITLALCAFFAASASAALVVQVVTIKPVIGDGQLIVEYQIVDDQDTVDTADDVVLRHGDQCVMAYDANTSTAAVQAAAYEDSWIKGTTTPPEGWTPPSPESEGEPDPE
ncbi:hypothetical protein [Actomonas aquatica]|uniref:Uncharacterized protein n=1 Tax=Actomonas aquatica TaxID=2866162 RepID=A0ABZ1CCL4_9BACT|nr:hypothetical protein [Opitutus sp. WL0086]WRQ89412.1 hypothetical protein K1X11_008320 [Opitutus sp. WL0086]